MKKILLWILALAAAGYLAICAFLYFKQESFIFHPTKLPADFQFSFPDANYEERNITTEDGTVISGGLFKADSSKGLIFYLHGNAGALNTWGSVAQNYNAMGYDVFILDYRGFGKSEGKVSSEKQFYDDIRTAYNHLKQDYSEDKIAILGYSIGTGAAAMLASESNAKLLILLAPYYNLTDMMEQNFPFAPAFLLNYKFATNEFLSKTKMPVLIFHGDADNVIPPESSIKLKAHLKSEDKVYLLEGQEHGGMNDNEEYLKLLAQQL